MCVSPNKHLSRFIEEFQSQYIWVIVLFDCFIFYIVSKWLDCSDATSLVSRMLLSRTYSLVAPTSPSTREHCRKP